MVDRIPRLRRDDNVAILNYIRSLGTPAYQARVPKVTDANITQGLEAIFRTQADMNEFVSTLVNRIGTTFVHQQSWTNPLAEFKRGLIGFGKTVQEIQQGLIKSYAVNHEEDFNLKMLFGVHKPLTLVNYHTVNREETYPITVDQPTLRRAFVDDTGLSDFVANFIAAPMKSNNWDEFLVMCGLFAKYENDGGFWHVHSADVQNPNSDQSDAKSLLRQMRAMADTFTFISSHYNAARMPVAASIDDLVAFVTPEVNAALDVEAYASLFNVPYAEVKGRVIVIPQENWGMEGVQALLTTRDFFQIYDEILEATTQNNPANMRTNHFLNVRQIVSASTFVPSAIFWTGPGDEVINLVPAPTEISAIIVKDIAGNTVTEVERASNYYTECTVTTAEPGVNDGIEWSIDGNTSPQTRVNNYGIVSIGMDETASTITVVATASGDETKISTVDVTLLPEPPVVPEWPREDEAEDEAEDE